MIDLLDGGREYADDRVTFCDGILYIIYGHGKDVKCHEIILDAEHDEEITLADIAKGYPDVQMVIEEDFLNGHIFRYGNHKEGEWELVGKTIGFA